MDVFVADVPRAIGNQSQNLTPGIGHLERLSSWSSVPTRRWRILSRRFITKRD